MSNLPPKSPKNACAPAPAASTTAVDVDVTVVTYNSEPHLDTLVASLAGNAQAGLRIHLHVVDNDSKDDTIARLRGLLERHGDAFASTNITETRRNPGFGRAHNMAVAGGAAPYIFILNPDAELPETCLRRLIDAAEADGAQSDFAAWEPRQTPYEHPKVYDPVTMEPSWCSCAGLLVRRDAFERLGGFEPRIFMYCDDVDLSWRLREAGYRLRYVPAATFVHNSYAYPGEIKPVQFVYSRLSGLYVRARFGRWSDVLSGLMLYCAELFGSQAFPGQRRKLVAGLFAFARNLLYFRFSGPRRRGQYQFRGWDFSVARGGPYHEVVPADDLPKQPRVSVLIRTIGRQPMLRRALSSVANQTYRNIEVVIVEDGPETLTEFLDAFDGVEIVYKPLGRNLGRCEAGNEAMRTASGEYFVFLDEDDEFYADHVEQLVAELGHSGRKAAYATAFEVQTRYGADHEIAAEGPYEVVHRQPFSRLRLCRANYLPILAVLFHRSLFEQHGGFDPELDRLEDWDLWLRFAGEAGGFGFVDKTTALYRVPFDYDQDKDRRDEHAAYQSLIMEKRRDDTIAMTVGEIAADFEATGREIQNVQNTLSLTLRELRLLNDIYRRFPIFRYGVRTVIFVARKLTGR